MMRSMVVGLAGAAAMTIAAPVAAKPMSGGHGAHGGNGHDGRFEVGFGDFRSAGPADRGRHGRFAGGGYYGRGAYVDGSAWRSDSFNDWWHDQPHRAFPRWMASNQNCERLWWSGGGWRC